MQQTFRWFNKQCSIWFELVSVSESEILQQIYWLLEYRIGATLNSIYLSEIKIMILYFMVTICENFVLYVVALIVKSIHLILYFTQTLATYTLNIYCENWKTGFMCMYASQNKVS